MRENDAVLFVLTLPERFCFATASSLIAFFVVVSSFLQRAGLEMCRHRKGRQGLHYCQEEQRVEGECFPAAFAAVLAAAQLTVGEALDCCKSSLFERPLRMVDRSSFCVAGLSLIAVSVSLSVLLS